MSELYVGYLKTPRAHAALLRVVLPAMIIGSAIIGGVVAAQMRDPGDAVWDTGASKQWTGRVYSDPYPMLITDAGETFLLVEIGKFGAQPRVQGGGWLAVVEGFPLERDGRKAIELLEGSAAFTFIDETPLLDDEPRPAVPEIEYLRPVAVIGEIVDGKCFLGAMKPGDGKAHKACAVLCIRGGLPAMVRTKDETGAWVYPLLLVNGSAEMPNDVLDLVGEPVRIEGTLGRIGDLWVLDCEGDCVRPYPDLASP
ncbi:MAG: hypothetical protein Tsb0013_10890 [Phycisphaerales bacterium]